jgi:transcriptional regulator with XRE-family HTH domain
MRFAQKLRQLREAKGISEAKLAKLSGVRLGALHSYGLTGKHGRAPSFPAVVAIAAALGVTCEAFANCTDIVRPKKRKRPKQKGK